jgi:hypothetical protein
VPCGRKAPCCDTTARNNLPQLHIEEKMGGKMSFEKIEVRFEGLFPLGRNRLRQVEEQTEQTVRDWSSRTALGDSEGPKSFY